MNRVLFMQNCFVPDDNQFNRLKRSMESLIEWSNSTKTPNEYMYGLGGFIKKEYQKEILKLIDLLNESTSINQAYVYFFETNVGKGVATNKTVAEFSPGFDHLFLFDNDICFIPDSGDIPQMLLEQQEELNAIGEMKYPVISCNFKEHQVHNIGVLDFAKKVVHGMIKCSSARFGCIGGGCWLINKKHWEDVGGYTTRTIYGLDDGKFYLDTIVKKNRMVALSEDIYVIHPSDSDNEYNIMKADTNVNRVRKMDYDALSKDMDSFWNKRKLKSES